jgi:hypothetical protein
MAKKGNKAARKTVSSKRKAKSSRSAKRDDLAERLTDLKKNDPDLRETRLSEWVRANKPLLTAGGAMASGAATAVAWIIEHVDNITTFVHTVGSAFQTPRDSALDFDALKIGQESITSALDNDPVLISIVLKKLMERHQFSDVVSRRVDLIGQGIYP